MDFYPRLEAPDCNIDRKCVLNDIGGLNPDARPRLTCSPADSQLTQTLLMGLQPAFQAQISLVKDAPGCNKTTGNISFCSSLLQRKSPALSICRCLRHSQQAQGRKKNKGNQANVCPSFLTTSFRMKGRNKVTFILCISVCVANNSICWACCDLGEKKKKCEYYLSKRWQKLQEVVFSKVCILNWWKLWLAFSGRISDLGWKQDRKAALKEGGEV